jgi:hypothetical protein
MMAKKRGRYLQKAKQKCEAELKVGNRIGKCVAVYRDIHREWGDGVIQEEQ